MLGGGRVLGHAVQKFWGPETLEDDEIHQLLQTREAIDSSAFARLAEQFRAWYAWTVDLPGTYYLEVIDKLYKRNELASGHFVALGQRIDLAARAGAVVSAGGARRRAGRAGAAVRDRASGRHARA